MKNLVSLKDDILIMLTGFFIGVCVVGVDQVTAFRVTVNLHILGEKGIQTDDAVLAVTDDLCIGVAPEQQMTHQCLPE